MMNVSRGRSMPSGGARICEADAGRSASFLRSVRTWRSLLFILIALAGGLVLLPTIHGAGAATPGGCGSASVDVRGRLTGTVDWCGPSGTTISRAIGVISVHYPGNKNPCGFAPERGPGGGWYEVPGDYQLVLSGGPALPATTGSAEWNYGF